MLQHLFRIFVLASLFEVVPAPSPTPTPAPGPTPDKPAGPTQADLDALKGALDKERNVNDAVKKFAAEKGIDVAAALQKLTSGDADQTELTALQKQVADLTKDIQAERTNVRSARIEAALTTAATDARARSANAVVALLRDTIELDDAGKPKGVKEAIAALQKDDPGLFRHADGRGDGGRPVRDEKDIQPGYDRLSEAYATDSTTANSR